MGFEDFFGTRKLRTGRPMSLRRYACAMVCLVFFAPKAAAQTATISSMAPGAEATTSTLYMVCGAYAAASESWDRVAATLDLTWPGGSRSNYAEFGPGGGTFSVSADVPYAQADVTVSCSLSVMSLATGATYFDGAQYVIRPSAPADLRIDSYGPLIWDFPDQGGGYHRDVTFQFYALGGGLYVVSNNIRERYTLGAPGSLGNTCRVPSIETNPNAVTLQNGRFTDRYGTTPSSSEGFLRQICQVDPNCQTFATQAIKVETSSGTQVGLEWNNTVRFYCATVEIVR